MKTCMKNKYNKINKYMKKYMINNYNNKKNIMNNK